MSLPYDTDPGQMNLLSDTCGQIYVMTHIVDKMNLLYGIHGGK